MSLSGTLSKTRFKQGFTFLFRHIAVLPDPALRK